MIKTVTVTNQMGESLTLDMRSPEGAGFFIRSIEGLGPSRATINTTESLSIDGGTFNSARTGLKNILFDLGYLEKPTIEHTRHLAYKYFPSKGSIKIEVETDIKTTVIYGYVESNEINIFDKKEGSLISVLCPDPYFKDAVITVTNFSSVLSMFSFPFSNESLVDKLIIFGNLMTEPETNVYYVGDVPSGFLMYIHAIGPVGTFTVHNLTTNQKMIIDSTILTTLTGSGIVAGDDIIISTIKGSKTVTLYRGGTFVNILNALGPDSTWFTLARGDNVFYYTATSGSTNLQFKIEHENKYEGV